MALLSSSPGDQPDPRGIRIWGDILCFTKFLEIIFGTIPYTGGHFDSHPHKSLQCLAQSSRGHPSCVVNVGGPVTHHEWAMAHLRECTARDDRVMLSVMIISKCLLGYRAGNYLSWSAPTR